MKVSLTALLFFAISSAYAGTAVFFPPNQAVLVIQGTDSDAKALYDVMNVAPVQESNLLKKKITLNSATGDLEFDLGCNYASLSNSASCTLKLLPGMTTTINKDNKYILFGVNDRRVARISKMFLDLDNDEHQRIIFHSIDGKLKFWKTLDSDGYVVSFTLEYRE